MYSEAWPRYSQLVCPLETGFLSAGDKKALEGPGLTPPRLLEAARLVRQRENSRLLKLSLDIEAEEEIDRPESIRKVLEIACASGTMKTTLECIENAKPEAVMLKVQAPFSALMLLTGSDRAFQWICSYPAEMHRALRTLTERTAGFCIEAIARGTPLLSLADPSGMPELLGKRRYEEFCAFYTLLLLRKLYPHLEQAVAHICPRTSLVLEKLGLLHAEVRRTRTDRYADAVLELAADSTVRWLGHRCINAEQTAETRAFVLHPDPPSVCIRPMEDADWDAVARIYGDGIRSGKATVVKTLPEKRQWLAAHRECLVAEHLHHVVGFAALGGGAVPEISIYIEDDFRRLGVGTALITRLQSRTEGKIRSLIFACNEPSIRLHEKMGFCKTDSFRFADDPRPVLVYEWEAKR